MSDLEKSARKRSLKIEAVGDAFYRKIKPRIRLTGHWLEKAGFKPGGHVSVHCFSDGIMELRSNDAPLSLNDAPTQSHAGQ